MSEEDLERYESEIELALVQEYRAVLPLFSYVVETERRFYLANNVEVAVRDGSSPACVEVTLTDGTRLTETVKAVRGTAENPMPREEVIAKARDLMTPILGAERCNKLIQTTMGLEKLKSIHDLRPLLQRS